MKIGILTFHDAYNYGAMLQATALQDCLKKYGETKIIDFKNSELGNKKAKKTLKVIAKKILASPFILQKKKRMRAFDEFKKQHMNLTAKATQLSDLGNIEPFDVYIVGSDQVWNSDITRKYSDVYFLPFAKKNSLKVSYAASIGKDTISDEELKMIKKEISNFDSISVREESARKMLGSKKHKVYKVADPTLLQDKSYWDRMLKSIKSKEIKEKYIFAYLLEKSPSNLKIVNDLSKKTGLKVVYYDRYNSGYKKPLKKFYTSGPIDFIKLIKGAEYTVCSSFHGMIFSTIYEKNQIIIPHSTAGNRMRDFVKEVGLERRVVNRDFDISEIDNPIDYNAVNEKIEKMRQSSKAFIDNAIENKNEPQ